MNCFLSLIQTMALSLLHSSILKIGYALSRATVGQSQACIQDRRSFLDIFLIA
jgi:hypothetical protein